jgi:hypothetical protein
MINVKRLRCFIGWLAILLPWIVVIQSLIFGHSFPESISTTYYREECIVPFMIILGSASFLLMYYDGYDKVDDILNTAAGIFGLCICLFPTYDPAGTANIGTFQVSKNICGIIHLVVAVVFFAILSYVSLFQFTKSSGEMTKQKKIRNIIYRICGIGMIASFLLLLLPNTITFKIWLVEAIALLFFGISWLTKSNAYT